MKRVYRLAPLRGFVAESESYYTFMAEQGYRLQRTGAYLDRFSRDTPRKTAYRVEIAQPGPEGIPEEQRELYRDCGWQYVDNYSVYHVFASMDAEEPPEIHTLPELQAKTIRRLRREGWVALAGEALWLALLAGRFLLAEGGIWEALVEALSLIVLLLVLIGIGSWWAVVQLGAAGRIIRRLKAGQPLDHGADWRPVRRKQRRMMATAAVLILLCGLWAAAEGYVIRRDLPQAGTEFPCLLLEEVEDVRRASEAEADDFVGYSQRLEIRHTLLAPLHYHTYEKAVSNLSGRDGDSWMYQDYYETASPWIAQALGNSLADSALFAKGRENFREISCPGLDWVLVSEMELVARKGNRVLFATYWDTASPESLARSLAAKWAP